MLKKFFLGLIALFFVLFGSLILLMGYVLNNPSSIFHAFQSMTEKIVQNKDYEESEEFFLQGITTLSLESRRVDIKVIPYSGATLKIKLTGQVPRMEGGPFIVNKAELEHLDIQLHEPIANQWFQLNINGQEVTSESDSHLTAEIFLPKNFKETLNIKNEQGSVELNMPTDIPYELDLQSVSGKIENTTTMDSSLLNPKKPLAKIQVSTKSGHITAKPSHP